MAFLLLLVTFRSLVIPIKAIVLNLLSVGAAYGVMVADVPVGLGRALLGFESNGAITAWLPMFMFVILFGLSMDYHVFILSRIREAVDRGMSTDDAVAHGIKSTAGVVTSAAVVMVSVFAIFATLSSLDMKQMGVGLAAAILIDATIVRGVLLPASDEAARQVELVPAAAAAVPARAEARGGGGSRRARRRQKAEEQRGPAIVRAVRAFRVRAMDLEQALKINNPCHDRLRHRARDGRAARARRDACACSATPSRRTTRASCSGAARRSG